MATKWVWLAIACLFAAGAVGAVGDILGPGEDDMLLENSIYRSEEARDRLMQIYDDLLARWPVPYEEFDLDTLYGTVHVIASGPEDGVPAMLLHASGATATSWGWNVEALDGYRVYAIDHIGEVNRSQLASTDRFPQTINEITGLYAEIADLLGVDRSIVIAGSNGGFIAMNYAIRYPERVSKLILTGPMGLTPPRMSMGIRLLAAQLIDLRAIQEGTVRWVLGTSPSILEPFGEWFTTMMRGSFPHVVPPKGIAQDDLAKIEVPVLLFLGTHDNLVGDHNRATKAASAMKDLRIEVLDVAHFVNVEGAEEVNRGIAEFLSDG